jgi:hypothetical protein
LIEVRISSEEMKRCVSAADILESALILYNVSGETEIA